MKHLLWITLGIVIVIALVFGALIGGWALWGQRLWAAGLTPAPTPSISIGVPGDCGGGWSYEAGSEAPGDETLPAAPCAGWGYGARLAGQSVDPNDFLTIADAYEAVEQYVDSLGDANLVIGEVMEFEWNFYAVVRESDTGIGAMELLVDKLTGAVGPEMGPNMMWNTLYGMQGRGRGMMGWTNETSSITPGEALDIARRWLGTYRPGVTVEEHADPFHGYYTIHTLEGGDIEGMLSVHGITGQVWYHTWHGAFIEMIEEEDH